MSQILGVKFNDYGQVYYFSSGPFVVREGQGVIVKTDQGMGYGKVVQVMQAPPEGESDEEHKSIYRLANDEDYASVADNNNLSREAYRFCKSCIDRHKLGMKLVDVEVFFDRSKMIFYFTAPGRIDFRELIKDLVKEYRTRIELRQIGVRHETQMLGAIGNCGQICCCRRFMRKFVPVTIKMAKEQNLFLNPAKISGICGRLLCCLSFEQEGYEEFNKQCPRIGRKFSTSMGPAKVIRSNFFNKSVTVILEGGEEHEVSLDEWQDMVNKPAKAHDANDSGDSGSRPSRRGGSGRPPRGRGKGGDDAHRSSRGSRRKGGRSSDDGSGKDKQKAGDGRARSGEGRGKGVGRPKDAEGPVKGDGRGKGGEGRQDGGRGPKNKDKPKRKRSRRPRRRGPRKPAGESNNKE